MQFHYFFYCFNSRDTYNIFEKKNQYWRDKEDKSIPSFAKK